MNILEEAGTADTLTDLHKLTLDELAEDGEAGRIVARLTRKDTGESEPVRVAAFNSFI
jgi:hypothetical protein